MVRKIYSKLNLPDFDETVNDLLSQLSKEKQYHKFKHQLSEETYKKVEERLKKYNKIKLQMQRGNSLAECGILKRSYAMTKSFNPSSL
jgi:hypothetical protein